MIYGLFQEIQKARSQRFIGNSQKYCRIGEDLKGAITVSCDDEFDATEVRAELRCVEKRRREKWVYDERRRRNVRRVYWDLATLHSADPKAGGRVHLVPGFKKRFQSKLTFLLVDESPLTA